MEYFDRVPRLVWRDPKKNEVLPSRRFATFAAKQILETLLGASWEGKKRYLDEKWPAMIVAVQNAQIAAKTTRRCRASQFTRRF